LFGVEERKIKALALFQFWSAYAPCSSQYLDSVQLTLEQIDVIRRLIARYPQHMQFVTSADGNNQPPNLRAGTQSTRALSEIAETPRAKSFFPRNPPSARHKAEKRRFFHANILCV